MENRLRICRTEVISLLILLLSLFSLPVTCQKDTKNIAREYFEGYGAGVKLKGLSGGTGWNGSWISSDTNAVIRPAVWQFSGSLIRATELTLRTSNEDISYFRSLTNSYGKEGSTVWISFAIQKETGNGYLGLSCFEGPKEKLFIGTPKGSDLIRLGTSAMTSVSALSARRIIVRIDFHGGNDMAYLFIDPSLASIPDIEGANASFQGNLSFDRIRLAAGNGSQAGSSGGAMGLILIGKQFSDIVTSEPSTTENTQNIPGDRMQVISWEKRENGLWINTTGGTLTLVPFLDRTLRVQFGTTESTAATKSFAVLRQPNKNTLFDIKESAGDIRLETSYYSVRVVKASGQLSFYDAKGKLLIQEPAGGGRNTFSGEKPKPSEIFQLTSDDALYGLGQYRDNAMNLRNTRRELVQVNTQSAVPVIYSTNGWGLFWDNPSRTVFTDEAEGMSFVSDYGKSVNYYLFIGSKLDSLIDQYRQLTGTAPMLPRWALGYHQSRNKYATQEEVLSVAERMRKENIPMSSVFIDYYYWGKYGTGSHHFDEHQFPDVTGMIKKLHDDLHTRVVITVWPTFKPGSANYDTLYKAGLLLDGAKALDGTVYDAFNPKAAKLYWKQVSEQLVPLGVDGWFLDGPEPDQVTSFLHSTTFEGPATLVRNVFPLVHSTTFYNGLLEALPNRRPYILTRCAWASQQRNSTAVWSGDIPSTFAELKTQVTAGLNFVATGIPYWTTDIGGYSGGNPADSAYQETYVRWWEYGVFCPIFRSHGRRYPGDTKGPNELWAFGPNVQAICTDFDNLRYRLLPYIYSLSGEVTQKNYTPMRLLAFDFPEDKTGRNCKDQFMYGPALLVNPVTDPGLISRKVYLPAGTDWIDFWTGELLKGGQTINTDAPISRIPIFVRAGSILPLGPIIQYANEKCADPIELRVYRGANGSFTLYEDDGESFDYKNGQSSRINIVWDEKAKKLTIGKREGNFKGMQTSRTFHIVWVEKGNGTGVTETKLKKAILYNGNAINIFP